MNYDFLKGTGVALVTPFNNKNQIDFPALKRLVEYVISGGVNYLVVLGTTGEPPTLNTEEQRLIFEFILETVNQRVPVVAGIGGNNTASIIKILDNLTSTGISAILSASPYYNRPSQEGIFQHYKVIAENSDLPIVLYNVPARTGSNITADTSLRLAHKVNNIAGIKEASGNFDQFNQILAGRPTDFLLLSGDDAIALPMIALGAEGLISVAANAIPYQVSEMVGNALKGDFVKARAIHTSITNLISLIFKEGNPAGVKSLLDTIGICGSAVRLPLVPASKELAKELASFKHLCNFG